MTEEKKQKKSIKEFKNIYNLAKKDKWKLLIAFICIFISSLLSITNGWLQGEVTESIVTLNIKMALFYLGIYFVIGVFFNNILDNIGTMIASKIEANLSRKLSIMVYKKHLICQRMRLKKKQVENLLTG